MEVTRRYANLHKQMENARRLLDRPAKSKAVSRQVDEKRRHKAAQRLDSATISELIRDYDDGIPTTQLTAKYQLGKGTVIKLLHEHGVVMRRQGLPRERLAEAMRLYVNGWSTEKIGRQLDCDAETVRQTLIRHGVVMRGAHERCD